jgi:cyclopropane fatty-acyl-phospholipid synthase-like methyltransferase
MLDPQMQYSCAYWKEAERLEDAQIAKLRLICEKLQLKPGMRVLDIGCGWGGLAQFMAQNYAVSVVGVTISAEQQKLAQQRCMGLDVDIRLQDYRDLNDQFDRIVSVGMFEHVGPKITTRTSRSLTVILNRMVFSCCIPLAHGAPIIMWIRGLTAISSPMVAFRQYGR